MDEKVLICGRGGYHGAMETKSVVFGGAATLLAGGLLFGLIATANADSTPTPVVSVTTSAPATTAAPTPTPEPAVTTTTPEPVATTPAPAPVVEPAPIVVPAPVVEPAPVVSPAPAATLPNGMTTVQVPGGPPPIKMGTSVDPGDGSKAILNPTLQDVGPTPQPIAGK